MFMSTPRAPARSFRDLLVWRKAHEFVLAVYAFTAGFPRQETRRGKADKARFMNLAEGSLEESRYYLILAQDLGYGDVAKLAGAVEEVSRMLSAYAAAILTPDS